MKKRLMLSALLVVLLHVPAFALVLTFDDIALPGEKGPVPQDYGGLTWGSDFRVQEKTTLTPGFQSGVTSGLQAAYNGWGHDVIISGDDFDFAGAYLTPGYNNGLNIQVIGRNNGVTLYDTTVVTSSVYYATWFNFNYAGIDELIFIASGGTPYDGSYSCSLFVMDDFTFTPVPEPASLLLLGSGLLGLAGIRRKMKS